MIHARPDPRLRAILTEIQPLPGVRAGSALVRWHGELLVVQDDAFELAFVTPRADGPPTVRLVGVAERLGPLSKLDKPDFESAVVHAGAIYVLGSGSGPQRRTLSRLVPDPYELERRDAGALFDALATKLAGYGASIPNIEGALAGDVELTLFHRGGGEAPSVALAVSIDVLDGAAPHVTSHVALDLGAVGDVLLTITDAAAIPSGYVYLACAEDTPNAFDDGPILGSAIGVVRDGEARYATLFEASGEPSLRKCEGLVLDDDLRGGYVVTDPDSPDRPAEICRLTLEGPWFSGEARGS